jgi:hypothetical protein
MNKTMGGSYHNLAALAEAQFSDARQVVTTAPSPLSQANQSGSALSLDSQGGRARCAGGGRCVWRGRAGGHGWRTRGEGEHGLG